MKHDSTSHVCHGRFLLHLNIGLDANRPGVDVLNRTIIFHVLSSQTCVFQRQGTEKQKINP